MSYRAKGLVSAWVASMLFQTGMERDNLNAPLLITYSPAIHGNPSSPTALETSQGHLRETQQSPK